MRNLKKVLALVLAVVMIFGVMSLTSATFTDDAKVSNTEAVEVMAGLQILTGYTDGSYQPAGNVTREEMATIICKMLLGPDVAKTLVQGTSNFKDVAANRWSAGYIEYCANLGIIDGYGDGTFNPAGNVTIGEAAKMLLVAAGIKGTYTGADWLVNVTANATKAGILPTTVDVRATATRDQVALYAFNALTYSANPKIVYNVYDATTGFKATYTDATQAYMAKLLLGASAVVTTATVSDASLGYKTFKLVGEAYTDMYGRPATLWYTDRNMNGHYDGKFVNGAFTVADEYVYLYVHEATQVYTTPIDNVTFREMIASYNAMGLTVTEKDYNTSQTSTPTNFVNMSGYGTRTEIYVDYATRAVTIVYVYEDVGVVTNITSYPATAFQGAYTLYTIQGHYYENNELETWTATIKVWTSHVKDLIEKDTGSVEGNVTVGTVVVLTVTEDFLEAKPATSVAGVMTTYDRNNQTAIVNGTTYNIADCAFNNGTYEQFAAGLTAQFYLDQYGYIAYIDYTQAVSYAQANYVAVYDSKTSSGTSVTKYIEAQLVFEDGTTKVVTVDKIDGMTAAQVVADAANNGYVDATGLVADYTFDGFNYTVNETTGVYTLTKIKDADANATIRATQWFAQIAGAFPYVANNNTTFVVRTGNAVTGYKWTVYTGFEKLPTLLADATVTAIDKNRDNVQDLVYIVSDAANTAAHDYVYITSLNYTINYIAPGVVTVTYPTADGKGLTVEDPTDITATGLYLVTEYTPAGAAADGKVTAVESNIVKGPGAAGLFTVITDENTGAEKVWHYTADSKLVVFVDGVPTDGYTFETLLASSAEAYEYTVKAYIAPQTVVQGNTVVATDWINTAYVTITTNVIL